MQARRAAKWIPSIDLEKTNPRCGSRYHHCCISIDSTSRSQVSDVELEAGAGEVRHTALSVLDALGESCDDQSGQSGQSGQAINAKVGEFELFVCDQKESEEAHVSLFEEGKDQKKEMREKKKKYEKEGKKTAMRKSSSTSSLPSLLADSEADTKSDKDPTPSYSSDSRRLTPVPPDSGRHQPENRSKLAAFLFDSVDTDTDDDDLFLPATTININDYRANYSSSSTATISRGLLEGGAQVKVVPRHVPSRMLWEL